MKWQVLKEKGFTQVETLIASVVCMALIGASIMVYVSQQKGYVSINTKSAKLQNARVTTEQLGRMIRQAGMAVTSGSSILDARSYQLQFRGDIDGDIEVDLAENAAAGATELLVDLDDETVNVQDTDSIQIQAGAVSEIIDVRTSGGPAFSLDSEPDIIYLSEPLTNSYQSGGTTVRTIETVSLTHDAIEQTVELNDEVVATHVTNMEFHYYNDSNTELIPENALSLNAQDRANIRKVQLVVDVGDKSGKVNSKRYETSVKPRNLVSNANPYDTMPPAAPTGLVISETYCGHFTISFNRPINNQDGSELTDLGGHRVYITDSPGEYWQPSYPISDEAATETVVADRRLINGTTYYVTMTAYDTNFNESQMSAEATFMIDDTTGPAVPIDVAADADTSSITIDWQSPPESDDVYGFRLYRGESPDFDPSTPIADENILGSTDLEYTDTDVETCKMYYYKVAAVDCANEGAISDDIFGDGPDGIIDTPHNDFTQTVVFEEPANAPDAATGFTATGFEEFIRLDWVNPRQTDFAGVHIRWSMSNYPQSPIDGNELGDFEGIRRQAGSTYHEDLTNGLTYYYTLFAYDDCFNYSDPVFAQATPGTSDPIVEITIPSWNKKVKNGLLRLEAKAYDPDETNLSDPPDLTADNGKGITSVMFSADPMPDWMDFPKVDNSPAYCGFGGTTISCYNGDVAQWCDGVYNVYAVATDNEGNTGQSEYRKITIENGGLYVDESYMKTLTGDFQQEVNFQIVNTAPASSVSLRGLIVKWARTYARLAEIQIPAGNTIWSDYDNPVETESWVWFDYYDYPILAANETSTVKFIFRHWHDELSSKAWAGDTRVYLDGNDGAFSVDDSIFFIDGSKSESVLITGVGSNYVDLATPLENTHSKNTTVSLVEDLDNSPMSSAGGTVAFNYQMAEWGRLCDTIDHDVTVDVGPQLYEPMQDEPEVDTDSTQAIGALEVINFKKVWVHVKAIDYSQLGFKYVKVYYKYDDDFSDVAPTSGYGNRKLKWDSANERWGKRYIPYSSFTRVWYYFKAKDKLNQTVRLPASGAFTYDYVVDDAVPDCPTGLTVAKEGSKLIKLSWDDHPDDDIRGYNIYRSDGDCAEPYSRRYSLVQDADPNEEGVQFWDDWEELCGETLCYGYYVTAKDMENNESQGCYANVQFAGDCPCPE